MKKGNARRLIRMHFPQEKKMFEHETDDDVFILSIGGAQSQRETSGSLYLIRIKECILDSFLKRLKVQTKWIS